MTIPAGFHEWAQARNVTPFHPGTWSPADHVAFRAFKLAAFKARWRASLANGDVAATRRQQGQAYLVRRVQDDLAGALAPAPSAVYSRCPCHPAAFQRADDTLPKEPRTPAEIVAWLSREFSPGTAALRQRREVA